MLGGVQYRMAPTSELETQGETPAEQGVICERHLSGRKALFAAIGMVAFLVLIVAIGYLYLHTH